eukprot:253418-Alexandrium_andersonii.AAC.1
MEYESWTVFCAAVSEGIVDWQAPFIVKKCDPIGLVVDGALKVEYQKFLKRYPTSEWFKKTGRARLTLPAYTEAFACLRGLVPPEP